MNFFRHLFISVLKITPIICVFIFIPEKTFASCSPYPFKEGLVVKEVEGGIKLTSTTQVKVLSDNAKDIMNALKEAELLSIIQIRRFFYESMPASRPRGASPPRRKHLCLICRAAHSAIRSAAE